MSFLQRRVGEHGIYRRRFKEVKSKIDGFRKHRSLATAPPAVGMTCFLKPATTIKTKL